MKKPHALEMRFCKTCQTKKLHEISWLVDHEHQIYQEFAECLRCQTETSRQLTDKEVKDGKG